MYFVYNFSVKVVTILTVKLGMYESRIMHNTNTVNTLDLEQYEYKKCFCNILQAHS